MANEIVAKNLGEDCIFHSISYDAGKDCGPVAGMALTGGKPQTENGTDVVVFDQKYKGQALAVKYDTRPDLAALVAEYKLIEAAKQATRAAKWAQKRIEQDAIDQPLIDAMTAEADRLRTQIPADHLEVTVTQTGDLDGDPILKYTIDGIKVNRQDVNIVGWASAIRPGAMGAFASVCVASISIDKLEQIRAAQAEAAAAKFAKKAAAEADRASKFAEAYETGKMVMLKKWTEDCNDPREECSIDIVSEYALPDGSTAIKRAHTW